MSVSDSVRVYLKNKPYTLEALTSGTMNFSALARVVQKELGLKNFYAVKAAIIRYAEELNKTKYLIEKRALPVLSGNKITLLNKVRVIISRKKLDLENNAEVKLSTHYVYLISKDIPGGVLRKASDSIVRIHENCSVIVIESAENLETVPGVIAFLTAVLAEQQINLVELISCYTETILVLDKKDALRSYELISEIIK